MPTSWYLLCSWSVQGCPHPPTQPLFHQHFHTLKVTKTCNWEMEKTISMRQMYQKPLFEKQRGVNFATNYVIYKSLKISGSHLFASFLKNNENFYSLNSVVLRFRGPRQMIHEVHPVKTVISKVCLSLKQQFSKCDP